MVPAFFAVKLDGGQWSTSRSGRFNSTEIFPGTHWIGDGPQIRPGICEEEKNRSLLPGIEPRPFMPQLIAIRLSYPGSYFDSG
jgi:hypothetical protein